MFNFNAISELVGDEKNAIDKSAQMADLLQEKQGVIVIGVSKVYPQGIFFGSFCIRFFALHSIFQSKEGRLLLQWFL